MTWRRSWPGFTTVSQLRRGRWRGAGREVALGAPPLRGMRGSYWGPYDTSDFLRAFGFRRMMSAPRAARTGPENRELGAKEPIASIAPRDWASVTT
ncbi:MAG: hypothetical protein J2P49_08555 [Methylocapsa sp.]|nr:hypothetical protein [Methylocapsa sp.]